MTFSSLIDRENLTYKFSSRQGYGIEWVIWHHVAGTNNEGAEWGLVHGSKKVSATYIIRTDSVVGSVPEEKRPWTTGWIADRNGITFETVNTTGAPNWEVSDWQIEKGIDLVVDIAYRYGWTEINNYRLRQHNEWANTACPGPFIKSKWNYILTQANKRLQEKRNPVRLPSISSMTFLGLESPYRFLDTRERSKVGPFNRLEEGQTYKIESPYTGRGILINVTAVGPSKNGWMTFYGSLPETSPSKLNFKGGPGAICNEIYVPLSGNQFSFMSSSDVDLIIDVAGVYR